MDELAFTGNSIHGICPILSFDSEFDTMEHLKYVKQALIQVVY